MYHILKSIVTSFYEQNTLTLFTATDVIAVNERMLSFLKNLKTNSFTRDEFQLFFKGTSEEISERTARNDIEKLEIGGWVEKKGEGPSTKYVKTNKILPDFAG